MIFKVWMIVFYAALSAFMVYLRCLLEVTLTLNVEEVSRRPTGHLQYLMCSSPHVPCLQTAEFPFVGKNIQAAIMVPLKHNWQKNVL